MQPYAIPRPNNLWTTRNIMIIILVGVVSILVLMFPLDIGNIYHREAFFVRNYEAMERDFKIFVYPDGKPTTCYNPKDEHKSKYASEHYFLKNLNTSSFLTDDPAKAHLFSIPFSCRERGDNEDVLKNYVEALITSPYWKRTLGADHFFFSCHDSVSRATEEIPIVMKNAIRLVCSPSYDSKYIPHKDVSLPQTWELSLPPDHGDDVWSK